MNNLIEKATLVATAAHKGQTRWDASIPYITHPLQVAQGELLRDDPIRQAVAILHDVVEDTNVTIQDIERDFPFEVSTGVAAMTQNPGEGYLEYIMRVKANPIATDVKIEDIKNNAKGIKKKGSMYEKYRLAIYILSGEVVTFN